MDLALNLYFAILNSGWLAGWLGYGISVPVLCIGAGKPQQQIQLDNLHFGSRNVLLETQWSRNFDVESFFPYVFTKVLEWLGAV